MKTFKVVGMNTDKRDEVLGISVLSKKAYSHLAIDNKKVVGYVARKEKTDKKGTVIKNSAEVLGELEVSETTKKVYAGNPSSFISYIETHDGEFLKVVKMA